MQDHPADAFGIEVDIGDCCEQGFLEEPVSYIRGAGGTLETMVGHRAMDALGAYVPEHYAWWVFLAACVLGGATLGMMLLGQGRATVGDP